MSVLSRQRLGTISILLGAIPVLALASWFVFYTPCGHPRRTIIEGAMFWGTIVAVPFGIFAAVKEKPRKLALIGLTLGLVPFACCIVLIIAIVYSVATGGRGLSGILDVNYAMSNGAPMTFEPGVFVTSDTKYYDVKGATMQELEAETSRSGPHGFIAETVPYYHWNYTYQSWDGSCRIEKVRVDTKIVFTYPRWNEQPADGTLTEEWTKRLVQLQQHEGEHEAIARNAGREIYDTLVGIAPAPSCPELEKEIEARAQAVIAKEHEANDELDRVTDHGKRLADGNGER